LLITVLCALVLAEPAQARPPASQTLLPEGLLLKAVEGRLVGSEAEGIDPNSIKRWFFEFDSPATGEKSRVKTAMKLELLPSAGLEQMVVESRRGADCRYRLWARVTKYHGCNYLFPFYFLLVCPVESGGPKILPPDKQTLPKKTATAEGSKPNVIVNEPNDVLTLPDEVLEKTNAGGTESSIPAEPTRVPGGDVAKPGLQQVERRRIIPAGRWIKSDVILAGRSGFIRPCSSSDCCGKFVCDGLGWNLEGPSCILLPSEALERAEEKQAQEPEPVRFVVSGIVTEYKGKQYLLLENATRIYSYGNFAP